MLVGLSMSRLYISGKADCNAAGVAASHSCEIKLALASVNRKEKRNKYIPR